MSLRKELKALDGHCRNFIAKSPFVLIGSSDGNGNADVTPKGDNPACRRPDDVTLAVPDRPGVHARIGRLFARGAARSSSTPCRFAVFPGPELEVPLLGRQERDSQRF